MTIAIVGNNCKKLLSYSSASTIVQSPLPNLALVPPKSLRRPPTITVGSIPALIKINPIIEVVVVLPCVPDIDKLYFNLETSASISARRINGIPFSMAAFVSGFSLIFTADEYTTTSAPSIFSAL